MEGARGYDGMIRVRRVRGPTLEVVRTEYQVVPELSRIASSCISPLMQELAICIYNLCVSQHHASSKALLRVSARLQLRLRLELLLVVLDGGIILVVIEYVIASACHLILAS